jgi:hypothetical protein
MVLAPRGVNAHCKDVPFFWSIIPNFFCSIHEYEPVPKVNASTTRSLKSPPGLPAKPISQQEENHLRNYFPVSWRVIGGGVLIGDPNRKHDLATPETSYYLYLPRRRLGIGWWFF